MFVFLVTLLDNFAVGFTSREEVMIHNKLAEMGRIKEAEGHSRGCGNSATNTLHSSHLTNMDIPLFLVFYKRAR